MQHIDKEVYIAVIAAAAQIADNDKCPLDTRVAALPKAFNALMDAVQNHKDKYSNSLSQDNQNLN